MDNRSFDRMCQRAKEEPHIAHRGKHGVRILAVFEDSLNRDTSVVPADGKGKLHFYVLNGSHRNLDVSLESSVVFGMMRFTQPNGAVCKIPALPKDTGKLREKVPIEGTLKVCKDESVDSPQEIFTTVPQIRKVEVKSGEEAETYWKELRNIIWTSPPGGAHVEEVELSAPAAPALPQEVAPAAPSSASALPPVDYAGALNLTSGEDRKRLHEAIMSAYKTREALRRMVSFTFDVELDTITKESNLPEMVFNVIRWAEHEGRVGDLLRAVAGAKPRLPL